MVDELSSDAPTPITDAAIAAAITSLCQQRGPTKTICPSEVARVLAADWRSLMPVVRRVAAKLAAAGQLTITQKGVPVCIEDASGPIRLSIR
ncbi:MAG: DUF3253 domain-containing protein [Pseudomonadota bacterium]